MERRNTRKCVIHKLLGDEIFVSLCFKKKITSFKELTNKVRKIPRRFFQVKKIKYYFF